MNELDCMVAHVNCGNAIIPGIFKMKHTYVNVHGTRGNWLIRLEADGDRGHEVATIKGYRKAINWMKARGWNWAKLVVKEA